MYCGLLSPELYRAKFTGTTNLNPQLARPILRFIHDRVAALKRYGLSDIWLRLDADADFNIAVVLGILQNDWADMMLCSGFVNKEGRLINVTSTWATKLLFRHKRCNDATNNEINIYGLYR